MIGKRHYARVIGTALGARAGHGLMNRLPGKLRPLALLTLRRSPSPALIVAAGLVLLAGCLLRSAGTHK